MDILSTAAEEITSMFHLVWGGIGITINLNYEIMSTVMRMTTKIVQLLLLLTQKVSQLFYILMDETVKFLGDVGEWVLSIYSTSHVFIQAISNFIDSGCQLVDNGYKSTLSFLDSIFISCGYGISAFVIMAGNLAQLLKSLFILFGSSVMFCITFIPNILTLLVNSISKLLANTRSILVSYWVDLLGQLRKVGEGYTSCVEFLADIPQMAYLGAFIGLCLLYCCYYAINRGFLIVPDTTSVLTSLRRRISAFHLPNRNRANNFDVFIDCTIPEEESIEETLVPNDRINIIPVTTRPPLNRIRSRRTLGLTREVSEQEVLATAVFPKKKTTPERSAKELYLLLEQERDTKLCIICQDKPKTVILLPCRHMCVCASCRVAISAGNNSCPICRRVITDTLKVYT